MNRFFSIIVAASVLVAPLAFSPPANAAPDHHDSRKPRHDSWVRGHRISETDRHRAVAIDYRRYRLSVPPRGYRWVRIGNSFLMIGVNSGLISKVVVAR